MHRKLLFAASGLSIGLAAVVSCSFDTRETQLSSSSIGSAPDGGIGLLAPVAAARLAIEPMSLDLGPAVVGSPARARLAVVNAGDAPLTPPLVAMLTGSDTDFIILHNQCDSSVGPGERCDVRVQLIASELGPSSGTLSVEGSGQTMSAALSGFGVASGPLTLAPEAGSSADFGGLVLAAGTKQAQFIVSNPTAEPSGPLTYAVNDAQFSLLPPEAGDCEAGTTALVDGEICRVRVAFSPTRRGAVDTSLVVTSERLGSTSLPLTAVGWLPAALGAPDSIAFGGVVTGSTGRRTLQLQNLGDEPLALTGVALSSSMSLSVEGTAVAAASAFSVQNSDCGAGDVLAGGARCSVTIGFRPLTAVLDQSAQLLVSAGGVERTVALSGSGLPLGALAIAPSPGASQDFGELRVGESATQRFVVTNTTTQPSGALDIQALDDFVLVAPAAEGDCESGITSLVNGESCAVAVTLTPSEPGQHDGGLTISSALAGAAHLALTGRALGGPRLSLARPELNFGRVQTETPVRQLLTILNTGDQPLSVVQASLEAPGGGGVAGFSFENTCQGQLAANSFCDIAVDFVPTEATAYSAVLRLASDTGNAASALLLGQAFPRGSLVLTPAAGSSNFGDVAVGAPSTLQFTLTNTGDVPSGRMTILSSSPLFSIDEGDCNAEGSPGLVNGASCTFSITFDPASSDQIAANLSVRSPVAGETALPLSGRGRIASNLNATGSRDLGQATVGETAIDASNQFTWTITNEGDLDSGPLQITNSNEAEFVVSNDTCASLSIPGRGTCTLDILFRPSSGGARSAILNVSDAVTTETLQLVLTGTGLIVAQPGESCLNGETCASGICTAGICCDRECAGTCQACNAGVCNDQVDRQACGNGNGRCFGVNQCLLPELVACTGDDQCGNGNCEARLGGQNPNDRICCLDDCGSTGQQCNPQTGRCQVPELAEGAACGAAGQVACGAGLSCKVCSGGGRVCTPVDECCGECAAGYACVSGECGCPIGSNGVPQIDCGNGQCILDREFACCTGSPQCNAARPVCDGSSGLCVQCLTSADCGPCSTCSGNACNPVPRGQAGGCGAGLLCDGSGACFAPQCTGPGQCGDCRTCSGFACINAQAGASCSNNRVCTADLRCVQCSSDAQCGVGERCDLTTNSCVSSCVPSTEACDGRDNDCDGQVDEGFSLQTDSNNCGQCGRSCGAGVCVGGSCGLPDGEPCTSPAQCQSGACTRWLADGDGDGFGSEPTVNGHVAVQICGDNSAANRPPPLVAGQCRGPGEFQYEAQNKDAANRPDCCDNVCPAGALNTISSATVFPGNRIGGTEAANCAPAVFSLDFNCDGTIQLLDVTPESDVRPACNAPPSPNLDPETECLQRSGFFQTAAQCGVARSRQSCVFRNGVCAFAPAAAQPGVLPTCL